MNFWNFVTQNRVEIADLTLEHLWMVGISTLLALAVGIPLGILISRRPALRKPVGIGIPSAMPTGTIRPTAISIRRFRENGIAYGIAVATSSF